MRVIDHLKPSSREVVNDYPHMYVVKAMDGEHDIISKRSMGQSLVWDNADNPRAVDTFSAKHYRKFNPHLVSLRFELVE